MLKSYVGFFVLTLTGASCLAQNVCPHYVWMHYASYCSYYATLKENPGECGEPVNYDSANCSYAMECDCDAPVQTVLDAESAADDLMANGYQGEKAVWLSAQIPIPRIRSEVVGTDGLRTAVDPLHQVIRLQDRLVSFDHTDSNGSPIQVYAQIVSALVVPGASEGITTEPRVLRRGFEVVNPLSGDPNDSVDRLKKDVVVETAPVNLANLGLPSVPFSTKEPTLSKILDPANAGAVLGHALLYRDREGYAVVVLNHNTQPLPVTQ